MAPYIRNYEMAAEYLAGGRMKDKYRPVSTNVYLARISADAIAVVLHSTAIVTYYADNTAVVFTGGWWSVTTKAKITEFTRLRPWGTGTYGVWGIGWTGERTPAKVQKCRARGDKYSYTRGCKGTGQLEQRTRCAGPDGAQASWHWNATNHTNVCAGNVLCKGQSYQFGKNDDGSTNYRDHQLRACVHDQVDAHTVERCVHDVDPANHLGHYVEACEHGQWEAHSTGTELVECFNCHGSGVHDYGSKPIAIEWDNGCVRVDNEGNIVDPDTVITSYPWAPERRFDWTTSSSTVHVGTAHAPDPTHIGGSLADDLAAVLPGLDAPASCPVILDSRMACDSPASVNTVRTAVVHLNDTHKWSRERIADWLDTLDVDLSFKVA